MRTIEDLYRDHADVLPDRSQMRFLDGWAGILEPLLGELAAAGAHLDMAKEKFGEMRVHIVGADRSRFMDAIECLRLRSRFTCETCGEPGRMRERDDAWLFTACQAHGQGVEPLPLAGIGEIMWRRALDDWWRSYAFDDRDRQITITGSDDGTETKGAME